MYKIHINTLNGLVKKTYRSMMMTVDFVRLLILDFTLRVSQISYITTADSVYIRFCNTYHIGAGAVV